MSAWASVASSPPTFQLSPVVLLEPAHDRLDAEARLPFPRGLGNSSELGTSPQLPLS